MPTVCPPCGQHHVCDRRRRRTPIAHRHRPLHSAWAAPVATAKRPRARPRPPRCRSSRRPPPSAMRPRIRTRDARATERLTVPEPPCPPWNASSLPTRGTASPRRAPRDRSRVAPTVGDPPAVRPRRSTRWRPAPLHERCDARAVGRQPCHALPLRGIPRAASVARGAPRPRGRPASAAALSGHRPRMPRAWCAQPRHSGRSGAIRDQCPVCYRTAWNCHGSPRRVPAGRITSVGAGLVPGSRRSRVGRTSSHRHMPAPDHAQVRPTRVPLPQWTAGPPRAATSRRL